MSKHFMFEYTVNATQLPSDEANVEALLDQLLSDPAVPAVHLAGAAQVDGAASIFLWANKAKARRLAQRLDELLTAQGHLALLSAENVSSDCHHENARVSPVLDFAI